MDMPPQSCLQMKQLDHRLQEHDSSSTQSTGESQNEYATLEGGHNHTYEKQADSQMKSVLSLGMSSFVHPTSQVGYNQPLVPVPFAYPDPYYGGFLAPSGAQPIIHPQMIAMAPTRVPLPLDLSEHEPIYVNAKQYQGILRRRECRAKLEAQNKLIKGRKGYLHESRHLHALKRVRGSGGRFMSKSEMQDCNRAPTDHQNSSESGLQTQGINHSKSEAIQSDTGNAVASTASCSNVSSVSNGGDMQLRVLPDLRFSGYSSHMVGSSQDGGGTAYNGSYHHNPAIR
ncbi:hypothetical protein Sjap_019741 [Stephania japonica]|uniref:Nuclear transcription factor Y subunit n=1 Tax=Stephania japonica TaxID=461633 RepID=A0AAP0F264_9MAGN